MGPLVFTIKRTVDFPESLNWRSQIHEADSRDGRERTSGVRLSLGEECPPWRLVPRGRHKEGPGPGRCEGGVSCGGGAVI